MGEIIIDKILIFCTKTSLIYQEFQTQAESLTQASQAKLIT